MNINEFSRPLISVIIPFYNRIPWTVESVKSVLDQTYQNFEILVVDDGSTESLDSLFALDDPRIRILHQNNNGPASARNHGMREARGDYIAFLDSDDLFEPTKLMHQLKFHLDNPDVLFSHTSYRYFGVDGPAEIIHSGNFTGVDYPGILYGCPIASPTVMFKRRDVIEQNIFMEEKYTVSEDIIFYSKIARHGKIIGIDLPLTMVRKTQSLHASSPERQIEGGKNIAHYLRNTDANITRSQKRISYFGIYLHAGYNYILLRNLPFACYYYLRAFWSMDGRVVLYLMKKALNFIRRIFRVKGMD